jgi:hypothetical protein
MLVDAPKFRIVAMAPSFNINDPSKIIPDESLRRYPSRQASELLLSRAAAAAMAARRDHEQRDETRDKKSDRRQRERHEWGRFLLIRAIKAVDRAATCWMRTNVWSGWGPGGASRPSIEKVAVDVGEGNNAPDGDPLMSYEPRDGCQDAR